MNGHRRDFSSSSSINEPTYGAGQHAQIEPSSQTLLNGYRDTLQSTNLNGGPSTVSAIVANKPWYALLMYTIGQKIQIKEFRTTRFP